MPLPNALIYSYELCMRSAVAQISSWIITALLVCGFQAAVFAEEKSAELVESKRRENKLRIVFLGDSITAGYGLQKSEAYPALIASLAKEKGLVWDCVNAGLSGDTTAGGVRRVRLLSRKPLDVMVVALGGNDGLRGIPPAATRKNIVSIVGAIRKAQPKVKVLLVGIEVPENMGEAYKKEFLKTFSDTAKELKVDFYPNLIDGIAGDPKFNQQDVIHPNVAGQKVIAGKVFEKLGKVLEK